MGQVAIISQSIQPLLQVPSFESELGDEALFGMWVEIIKERNKWVYVRTQYEYEGYVLKDDLVIENNLVSTWNKGEKYVIIHSIVDVMDIPKYQGHIMKTITRGSLIVLTGDKKDNWIEILLPDGKKGWIKGVYAKKWIKDDKKDEVGLRNKLVENAKLYLGTQYRWGGKTSMGIDCSGLCSMAYLLEGIVIYRDAVLKEEYMRKIEREEIKKGDLIFWPGHIGMYIENGKFIHSTSSRNGVVINSLNKEHKDYREDLDTTILGVGTIF